MGTPSVIDLDALRAPISETAPTGSNLSDQQVMYDLRSLADAARSAEKKWALLPYSPEGKQIVPEGTQTPPIPNWNPVLKACLGILQSQSKDLNVCGFLLESLARLHGFAGIRDGSRLVHDLAERYWGELFPPFDPDVYEALEQHPTIAGISGLNGSTLLPFAIDRIPLIRSAGQGPLSGIDYLDAYDRQLRITREAFETTAQSVPESTYIALLEDAEEALDSYRTMANLLNQKCQESHDVIGPNSSEIERSLEDAVVRIRHISGRTESASGEADSDGLPQTDPAGGGSVPSKTSGGSHSGPLQSREEAYEMLRKVADYFSRTEPHSPVSTALKRIVAWRTLSFPDLMKELVLNEDSLKDLYRLTGFRDQES